ncbi:phosphate ABC transporter permease subunit PstC [Nocardioides sp. TRM66260-LWL]|uniref:phosphate ABC transporter permease subunit PstC n=1 Tax=Nocardioides sp. TRM66260-LWL TaxID=2874478 RepID=UPI001CC360DF|nr:phosphate ABC transporter permease subunit PstC [Nocardioides sp. TRM66260-LWL]MBZ5734721.1 phosphate ABC transporter permease subunit PstC [Nocardioides sp. TRM66260-LWL]
MEPADAVFASVAHAGGILVLVVMTSVGLFLGYRALEALQIAKLHFVTEQLWEPDGGRFGIAGVLLGTISVGLVAITFALPLALGTSLFISEIAPRGLQRTLISLVDLMAAVPSVVYGLWGAFFLQSHVYGLSKLISQYLGWIPIFAIPGSNPDDPLDSATQYQSSIFIAGMVVALMITPIMTSVMREAFSQAPVGEREAALGLGATRWGMIRAVVLPFGRGGVIGGTMLGLGRALGETIAVYMILSVVVGIQPHILKSGGSTVSALIAQRYGDSTRVGVSALMAAGLALFLVTLVINFAAASVVARSRSGAEST